MPSIDGEILSKTPKTDLITHASSKIAKTDQSGGGCRMVRTIYMCKHQIQEPRIVHNGCNGVTRGKSRCDGFRFGTIVQVIDNQDCDSCKEKSIYKVFKDHIIVGMSGKESLKEAKVDDDEWDMVEDNAELDFEEGMIIVGTKHQRDAIRELMLR